MGARGRGKWEMGGKMGNERLEMAAGRVAGTGYSRMMKERKKSVISAFANEAFKVTEAGKPRVDDGDNTHLPSSRRTAKGTEGRVQRGGHGGDQAGTVL